MGSIDGESLVRYGDCTFETLPRWRTEVFAADGTTLRLEERFLPSENTVETGSASLTRAELTISDGLPAEESRVISDYWRLVYSAFRHNEQVRYWVVLDSPLVIPGDRAAGEGGRVRRGRAVRRGSRASLHYLGESFDVLESRDVVSVLRERLETTFRRGDANADGVVDASDSISLLHYLFRGGEPPSCSAAADADDNGRLNVGDPIGILRHLFGGAGQLPVPFVGCGVDPTPDGLACESFGACGG